MNRRSVRVPGRLDGLHLRIRVSDDAETTDVLTEDAVRQVVHETLDDMEFESRRELAKLLQSACPR